MTASPPPHAPARLNGWKEIAAYFGKGVRTVQRWEKDLGLPVRRFSTGRGEAVHALAAELEAWQRAAEKRASLDSRPGEDDAEEPLVPAVSETEASGRAPSPRAARWPWVAAGACLLLALAGAAVWRTPARSSLEPYEARLENHALRVYNQRGRLLWEHRFEFRIRPSASALGAAFHWTAVDDLDGDGAREVVFATVRGDSTTPSALFCFESRGSLRFRHAPRGSSRYGEMLAPGPWVSMTLALAKDRGGRKALWLASSDRDQFPTMVEKIDASGRLVGVFWHAGMVDQLLPSTYEGRPVMLAVASHNESHGGALAVLDNVNPTGTSPATLPKFACRGCPARGPLEYLVFPGGELERLQDNTAGLRGVRLREDGGYSVDAFHVLIPMRFGRTGPDISGYTSYELDPRLRPVRAESRPDWRLLRNEAHRLGIMPHPYGPADEAALWPLLRWNGTGYDELRPPAR